MSGALTMTLKGKVEIPLEAISGIFKGIERLEIELEAYRMAFVVFKQLHVPDADSLDVLLNEAKEYPGFLEKMNQKYRIIQEAIREYERGVLDPRTIYQLIAQLKPTDPIH